MKYVATLNKWKCIDEIIWSLWIAWGFDDQGNNGLFKSIWLFICYSHGSCERRTVRGGVGGGGGECDESQMPAGSKESEDYFPSRLTDYKDVLE